MMPYYSDDLVTLYHGDCLDLGEITYDLVITDPPYGMGLDTRRTSSLPKRSKDGRLRTGIDHQSIEGDEAPFDPRHWLSRPCAFTGANYFAQHLPTGRWHVWDKTDRGSCPAGLGNDFEIIWTSWRSGRSVIVPILWTGLGRVNKHPDSFLHPAQKPVALFEWIIERAPTGVILDPYVGSGSSLVAAKSLRRSVIGVEIDERYCEIAANRCAQDAFDFGGAA